MTVWMTAPAVLLAAALAASVVRKASRAPSSVELRDRLGVPSGLWSALGVLEGGAVLGLLGGLVWPELGTVAAAGVALLMVGAVLAHLRAGVSGRALLPPTLLLLVAVVVGLGFSTAR